MKIVDRVFGPQKITEGPILEIISSPTFLRLKRINQAGASQYLYPWKNVTRYEHSLGVFFLLRKYNALFDEQIAGLLHDIPHTAFSHVIDFVFENTAHEYHEQFHDRFVLQSEISRILKHYSIPSTVAHPEKFSLLESNIPDLCADRIDYSLRDYVLHGGDMEKVAAILDALTVYDKKFVFADILSALTFAYIFLQLDRDVWAHPRETAAYIILAQAIRHALEKQILIQNDLFGDDLSVYKKLVDHGDPYIRKQLAYLTPKFRIKNTTSHAYQLRVKTKARFVDPLILVHSKPVRLSAVSQEFKNKLEEHQQVNAKGWYVDIYNS